RHFAFVADAGFPAPARALKRVIEDIDLRLAGSIFDMENWSRPNDLELAKQRLQSLGQDLATPGLVHTAYAWLANAEQGLVQEQSLAAPRSASIVAVASSPAQAGNELALRMVVDIVTLDWLVWARP